MTTIELAQKFRTALLKREAQAVTEILRAYQQIPAKLEPQLIELKNQLAENPQISVTDL